MSIIAALSLVGWALALAFGCMFATCRVGDRRMKLRAAEAMHELRRPLQAMALSEDGAAMKHQLELALPALADLQRAILGAPPQLVLRQVELRPLVEGAVDRWRGEHGSAVELRWLAGDARAMVDGRRFVQALDNLIANALEHGGSPVSVEAAPCAAGLRISVRNRVAGHAARGEPPQGGRPDVAQPQARGHGLRIVSTIAGAHGGRFLFDCSAGWAVGVLELPLPGRALGTAVVT